MTAKAWPLSATSSIRKFPPPSTACMYSLIHFESTTGTQLLLAAFPITSVCCVALCYDQVRQTPQGDVSVPINVVYNHHFESHMGGKKSKIEKVTTSIPDRIFCFSKSRLSPHLLSYSLSIYIYYVYIKNTTSSTILHPNLNK